MIPPPLKSNCDSRANMHGVRGFCNHEGWDVDWMANNNISFITGAGAFLHQYLFGYSGLRLRPNGLEQQYKPMLPKEEANSSLTMGIDFRAGKQSLARIAIGFFGDLSGVSPVYFFAGAAGFFLPIRV